jgi:hypothetical protein
MLGNRTAQRRSTWLSTAWCYPLYLTLKILCNLFGNDIHVGGRTNIKIYLQDIGQEGVGRIRLVQESDHWLVLVYKERNFQA